MKISINSYRYYIFSRINSTYFNFFINLFKHLHTGSYFFLFANLSITLSAQKVKKKSGKKRNSKSKKTIKYTVRSGDTLKKIAKSKTGKSANASKIYAKNKSVIEKAAKKHGRRSSSKGRYIYQGTKLVITV